MTVIPAGYGQVNIFFGGPGLPNGAEITYGIQNVIDQSPQSVAAAVVNDWTNQAIMANFSSSIETTKVRVKLGPNEDGPFFEQAMSIGGSKGATVVTPQVSVLVKKSTSIGGRRGRGRFYMPGVIEADVQGDGDLEAAFITALNADLQGLLASHIIEDIPMVLLHNDQGSPNAVAALQVDPRVATQRRRLRG